MTRPASPAMAAGRRNLIRLLFINNVLAVRCALSVGKR
jgi:hypothetical protein